MVINRVLDIVPMQPSDLGPHGKKRITVSDQTWTMTTFLLVAIAVVADTSGPIIGVPQPYVSQCYQETRPDEWYVDCRRGPDGRWRYEQPARVEEFQNVPKWPHTNDRQSLVALPVLRLD
jgi:hypothetical protein